MFGSLFKGWLGEKVTQFGLWHHLNDQTYRRFHDVIVPLRNGTTQIDHAASSSHSKFHHGVPDSNGGGHRG